MIILYTRYTLLAVATIITSTIASIYSLIRPTSPANAHFAAHLIARVGQFILGFKVEIEGKELLKDLKPCVIISNHQNNLDIFVIGTFLPKRTVSVGKKSILYIPFFGQMYWLTGSILINRGNRSKAWAAMDKVAHAITKNNTRVWIMPEGTRSKGRGILKFKKGAFVTAIKAQVDVLPICFSSMDKCLDFTKINSGTMKIKILPPIDSSKYDLNNVGQYAHDAEKLVSREVEKLNMSCTNEK